MPASRRTRPTRSLATIVRGELLEIRCILFDGVRAVLDTAGIQLGDRVRCREATPTRLLLETDGGRVTWLDRRWASFVEAVEARSAQAAQAVQAAPATQTTPAPHALSA